MQEAINEAKRILNNSNDIPVGCVIKLNGDVIAVTHNMREEISDVTAHAEILAIQQAQQKLNNSRLKECEMFVTLEPCPMCTWAILQSGIKALYFGSYNTQYGAIQSVLNLPKLANSKIKIYAGMQEDICNKILEDFWSKIRK